MSAAAATSSATAPPLVATKAAYALLASTCQKYVATHSALTAPASSASASSAASSSSSDATPLLNAEQTRQVKNALNAFSQSVFVTARRHLRVRGRVEVEEPGLRDQVRQAQEQLKADRLALHALHVRAAQLVDTTLRAPVSHLIDAPTGRLSCDETPLELVDPALLPSKRREGAAEADALARESLRSNAATLAARLPGLLQTGADLSEILSSRGAQPLSKEVRDTLAAVARDNAAAAAAAAAAAPSSSRVKRTPKKSAASAAAAAAAVEAAQQEQLAKGTGTASKITKSPSAKRQSRGAAKPYDR